MSAVTVRVEAPRRSLRAWLANPWSRARFLWVIAIVYVLWSLLPAVIAVIFSFNAGKAQTTWQGFSLTRWYVSDVNSVWQDETLRSALFQSLKLSTMSVLLAVPFGVAFALALDRWRGRGSGAANFTMLFSFITPEIAIAIGLFLLFTHVLTGIGLGFWAQVFGLSMYEMAYATIIVRARLLSIGKEYEEAAMDLGASPTSAVRRVLLPMLMPAIVASAAIVFASSIDNFVISERLSVSAATQTIPIIIYASARRSPLPSLNALASLTLFGSTIVIAVAALVYRRAVQRERRSA
jgi:spermidine/putrescine transport system permease protein